MRMVEVTGLQVMAPICPQRRHNAAVSLLIAGGMQAAAATKIIFFIQELNKYNAIYMARDPFLLQVFTSFSKRKKEFLIK